MNVRHSFYSRNYNKNFFVSSNKETTSEKRSIRNYTGAIYYLQEFKIKHRIITRSDIQLPKIKLRMTNVFQLFKKNNLLKTEKIECYISRINQGEYLR